MRARRTFRMQQAGQKPRMRRVVLGASSTTNDNIPGTNAGSGDESGSTDQVDQVASAEGDAATGVALPGGEGGKLGQGGAGAADSTGGEGGGAGGVTMEDQQSAGEAGALTGAAGAEGGGGGKEEKAKETPALTIEELIYRRDEDTRGFVLEYTEEGHPIFPEVGPPRLIQLPEERERGFLQAKQLAIAYERLVRAGDLEVAQMVRGELEKVRDQDAYFELKARIMRLVRAGKAEAAIKLRLESEKLGFTPNLIKVGVVSMKEIIMEEEEQARKAEEKRVRVAEEARQQRMRDMETSEGSWANVADEAPSFVEPVKRRPSKSPTARRLAREKAKMERKQAKLEEERTKQRNEKKEEQAMPSPMKLAAQAEKEVKRAFDIAQRAYEAAEAERAIDEGRAPRVLPPPQVPYLLGKFPELSPAGEGGGRGGGSTGGARGAEAKGVGAGAKVPSGGAAATTAAAAAATALGGSKAPAATGGGKSAGGRAGLQEAAKKAVKERAKAAVDAATAALGGVGAVRGGSASADSSSSSSSSSSSGGGSGSNVVGAGGGASPFESFLGVFTAATGSEEDDVFSDSGDSPLSPETDEDGNIVFPPHSDCTTNGVRVEVAASYYPEQSNPTENSFIFIYNVKITNNSPETVQLVSRKWVISSVAKKEGSQALSGPGVVGQQPVLEPGESFEYSSACPLTCAPRADLPVLGQMKGSYLMAMGSVGEKTFEAQISPFHLVLPDKLKGR